MNFLDRLFHQLTRPPSPGIDEIDDEEFEVIDPSEITTVVNNNADHNENKLKENESFIDSVHTFFQDLNEETDVIRGTLDRTNIS